jgi:FtsP/CotA-like multicopper oxidase with cupredoxin domain
MKVEPYHSFTWLVNEVLSLFSKLLQGMQQGTPIFVKSAYVPGREILMAQTPLKEQPQESVEIEERFLEERKMPARILIIGLLLVTIFTLILAGALKSSLFQRDSTATGTNASLNALAPPTIPSASGVPARLNMGMPGAKTSITSLQAPLTAPHMKQFTLVAQNAVLTIGPGLRLSAWTFNGTAPGPTLRVQQGDLVVVHVINHLTFGITIHWHGLAVPNSQDGVAGLTQNAIQPGQSFTYRFFANDPGTYWYHSHQFSEVETDGGLFGALIVDPTTPTIRADVDDTVSLHEWNGTNNQSIFTMNTTTQALNEAARPGQWVRLRLIETSSTSNTVPHLLTLVGAPFKVIALDGHDLNAPQWLNETPLPIGAAQRYDLLFQMPEHGSVALVAADETDVHHYLRAPAVVIGQGSVPATLPAVKAWFDLTTYGQPAPSPITPQSHFDVTSTLTLNNQMGSSLGRMGMTYTINGKVFPQTGMIMVKYGQLVQIVYENQSDLFHPMHLHGHSFFVLTSNGKSLSGSPIRLDTILVPPHTTYVIGFLADNPGLWMLHCHNLLHANWGMDMMIMYTGYSTPYSVGTATGNFPD